MLYSYLGDHNRRRVRWVFRHEIHAVRCQRSWRWSSDVLSIQVVNSIVTIAPDHALVFVELDDAGEMCTDR